MGVPLCLELKSVKELHPAHEAQLTNYLKATGNEVGVLTDKAIATYKRLKKSVLFADRQNHDRGVTTAGAGMSRHDIPNLYIKKAKLII